MTEPLQPAGQALFHDHPDIELVTPEALTEEALIEAVRDVQGIAARSAKITPNVIAAAPDLRAVSRHGVGYDNIAVDALSHRKIPLLLAIHANAVSVAEHTMYFLLSLAKRGRLYDKAARESNFAFRNAPVAIDIAEKTLTIIGFGRIGTRLAPRALAFDMRVNVYDPYVDDAVISAAGATPVSDFRTVLGETDFLTVHCPLNAETRGIVGAAELAQMRANSFVINCARGGIVDETALIEALDQRQIAGAGVDVYNVEPPPLDHPLLQLENVFLSPHSAGVSVEAAQRMSRETADNLIAALEGDVRVAALANPEIG
ncbi:MAG: hydroxyacid dehydrogenase [Pseudomonadota bacterium]